MARLFFLGTAALLLASGAPLPALAGGFQVPTQGAAAAGQGDAFTAQANDPSAIHYNPAGLVNVPGTQVSTGLYAVFPEFTFDSPLGDAASTDAAYIPHLYLSSDLGKERNWRIGFGINNTFGLAEDWGRFSPLNRIVTSVELSTLNFSPALAGAINEHWSVGIAPNFYYGNIELNSVLPLSTGGQGDFRIDGEGFAAGLTAGTLYRFNEKHALGLTYRSPFSIEFEGAARIQRGPLPPIGPSDTEADLDFPQIIVLGYAYRPTPRLVLELDLQWADWETLDAVRIESEDPRFAALPARRFDYESSYTYRFGAAYALDRHWTVRGGYIFSPTSSPEETFTPAVVDLDNHIFTTGLGYGRQRWRFDIAYRLIVGEQRSIRSSINSPPGVYDDITHAVIATITFRF